MAKSVSPLTKRHKIISRSQGALRDAQQQHHAQIGISKMLGHHGMSRGPGLPRLPDDPLPGTNRAAVKRYTQAKKTQSGDWHPYGNPHANAHKFGGRRTGTTMRGARGH